MVTAAIELEQGLATVKMVAIYYTSCFELGQHPIDGGETDLLRIQQ